MSRGPRLRAGKLRACMSDESAAIIRAAAESAGMSISAFLEQAALEKATERAQLKVAAAQVAGRSGAASTQK